MNKGRIILMVLCKINCDEKDGLIIIDKVVLKKIKDDFLYSLDIYLDVYGETELVYDFPDEEWSSVRERETKELRNFCNQGNMVIWLTHEEKKCDCVVEIIDELRESGSHLHCESGEVIIVSASEFIQALSYPELEMDILQDLHVEKGWYEVSGDWNRISMFKWKEKEIK